MVACRSALVVALVALAGNAQELRVASGVVNNQVLQRGLDGTAAIRLSGTLTGKKVNGKIIQARLQGANGVPVANFDWKPLAQVQKTRWEGDLRAIPVGGPYRLDLRVQDSAVAASFTDLLVGDLWVLAGQSNMEGVGDLIDVEQPSPLVHSFNLADHWVLAEEPLHTLVNATDAVHWPLNREQVPERWSGEKLDHYLANRRKGAGLGLAFAVEMARRTEVPIGLLPCAHGGTSMDQWDPELRNQGGDSLYGSMLRRVRATGGSVKGVLWYQGESDANPKAAPLFEERFRSFVQAIRTDFNQPDLPFYYVQIGRSASASNAAEWNAVQAAQLRAESEIPHTTMVASVDLSLVDAIHIDTQGLKRVGGRLANVVCSEWFPRKQNCGALKRGPRPMSATWSETVSGSAIRVTFSGVNGRLIAEGRLGGFSLHGPDDTPLSIIYKARLDPADPGAVLLHLQGTLPKDAALWYGRGRDPYCNLRDEADMAAPVFVLPVSKP
jgi:sialate O-acetylesterase